MGIRIIIANDYNMLRQGLRALLEKEKDMEIVAEAGDGLKTVTLVREFSPHVVIMDVNLPNLNGIEASRQILSEHPEIKVIALSMHADRRYILNMLKAGAHGYVLMDCSFEELAHAIRLVMANKNYFSPAVTEFVVKDYLHCVPSYDQNAFSVLTGRERECYNLLPKVKIPNRSLNSCTSALKQWRLTASSSCIS